MKDIITLVERAHNEFLLAPSTLEVNTEVQELSQALYDKLLQRWKPKSLEVVFTESIPVGNRGPVRLGETGKGILRLKAVEVVECLEHVLDGNEGMKSAVSRREVASTIRRRR